jgi:SnoaL-like domain
MIDGNASGEPSDASKARRHMADSQALINRIVELEHRLALLRDEREIARLQNIYGFYLDNRMWGELAALFAENGEIEIGRRGGYRGRERVRRFLEQVLGQGRWVRSPARNLVA